MSVFPKYDPPNPNQTRTIKALNIRIAKAQNYLQQISPGLSTDRETWSLVTRALKALEGAE